jgi:hypothetical protein
VLERGVARFVPADRMNALLAPPEPVPVEVVHTDRLVVVVSGVLVPFLGAGVVLSDRERLSSFTAVVTVPNTEAVMAALREAGFEVEHYRMSVAHGDSIGSLTELSTFRREHADRLVAE